MINSWSCYQHGSSLIGPLIRRDEMMGHRFSVIFCFGTINFGKPWSIWIVLWLFLFISLGYCSSFTLFSSFDSCTNEVHFFFLRVCCQKHIWMVVYTCKQMFCHPRSLQVSNGRMQNLFPQRMMEFLLYQQLMNQCM